MLRFEGKKYNNGSLTIEAAFVLGLIVVIILAMIMFTLTLLGYVLESAEDCKKIVESGYSAVWDAVRMTGRMYSIFGGGK